MDVKERIQKYLDFKGIKTASFEREVGLSNGYWRKTKSISANIVAEVLRIYSDLSSDWVTRGIGNMCCQPTSDIDTLYNTQGDNSNNVQVVGKADDAVLALKDKEIKMLEDQVKFLKEQVEFYKSQKDA